MRPSPRPAPFTVFIWLAGLSIGVAAGALTAYKLSRSVGIVVAAEPSPPAS